MRNQYGHGDRQSRRSDRRGMNDRSFGRRSDRDFERSFDRDYDRSSSRNDDREYNRGSDRGYGRSFDRDYSSSSSSRGYGGDRYSQGSDYGSGMRSGGSGSNYGSNESGFGSTYGRSGLGSDYRGGNDYSSDYGSQDFSYGSENFGYGSSTSLPNTGFETGSRGWDEQRSPGCRSTHQLPPRLGRVVWLRRKPRLARGQRCTQSKPRARYASSRTRVLRAPRRKGGGILRQRP